MDPTRRAKKKYDNHKNTTTSTAQKVMSNRNSNDGGDDEAALLASIGSSVAQMDVYEQQVLEAAENSSNNTAPSLTGIGFPNLDALGPTPGAPLSDVPHVQTLLTKLRNDNTTTKNNDTTSNDANVNFMKEQLLLTFLQQVAKVDLPIHQEASQERRRSIQCRNETTQSNNNNNNKHKGSSDNKSTSAASLKSKTNSSKQKAQLPPQPKKSSLKDPLSQRLEDIKNNGGNNEPKSVSFAAKIDDNGENPATNNKPTRKRKRFMERHAEFASQNKQMNNKDWKDHAKQLRELRQQREERRKQRLAKWKADHSSETNNNADDQNDGTNSEETEFDDKIDEDSKISASSKQDSNDAIIAEVDSDNVENNNNNTNNMQDDDNPSNKGSSEQGKNETEVETTAQATKAPIIVEENEPEPSSPTTVTCPLCSQSINVAAGDDADETLSLHVQACENQRPNRRRGLPRRAAAATRKNYVELDDSDGDSDDDSNKKKKKRKLKDKPVDNVTDAEVKLEDIIDIEEDSSNGDNDDHNFDNDGAVVLDTAEAKKASAPSRARSSTKSRRSSSSAVGSRAQLTQKPTPIDDIDEFDYEDRVDGWIEKGVSEMRVMKEQDDSEVPPGEEEYDGGLVIPAWINDRLFSYQRTGLQWMWELHKQEAGGIIGDEMGLGKTVQVSAFLGSMASSRKLKSVLVISPATMLQHWLKELAKWAPGIRRILIHQSGEVGDGRSRSITIGMLKGMNAWLKRSRSVRLYEPIDEDDYETRDPASFCGTAYAFVTTFENIRRNPDIWTNHNWSYIVMDEAQKIRNPDADVTLACKRLKTPHRLALSGTPIQNDLKELWSLFDFVFPGRLGTLPAFENEFSVPIRRGGYSNASPMQVQLAYRCALILRDLINPYMLRRLKKDVKEVNRMPGKMEQVLFCRLTDQQRELYESFLQSDVIRKVLRGSTNLLGAVTTLRKICNHPDLVCPPDQRSVEEFVRNGFVGNAKSGGEGEDRSDFDEQSINYDHDDEGDYGDNDGYDNDDNGMAMAERSGKLEVLAKILPLWKKQGHRVLIFCQWKKMLKIIQRFTELQGWKFGRLDGDTSVAVRQKLVDTFNSDESYYGMLCTTRTGGVGLNLTGANRIILYDPDWNPQTDAQARERAWRFGQEREVTVYRLITAGTVEEKMYQRQIFKTALSNKILQDPRQRRLFSQKDLKDLFSLKSDGGSLAHGAAGVTETGQMTRGAGVVNPDDEPEQSVSTDDRETLSTVLRSKGLAGVFDHDIVENSDTAKSATVREIEEKAKQIAHEAAAALQESVANQPAFVPTYTGSNNNNETESGRFGGSRFSNNGNDKARIGFGRGTIAGVSNNRGVSSGSLLASVRERNEEIKSGGACNNSAANSKNNGNATSSTKQYTDLLSQIREFVRRKGPTTDEILDEFSWVPQHDAAIFRRLLKKTAEVKGGHWCIRKELG